MMRGSLKPYRHHRCRNQQPTNACRCWRYNTCTRYRRGQHSVRAGFRCRKHDPNRHNRFGNLNEGHPPMQERSPCLNPLMLDTALPPMVVPLSFRYPVLTTSIAAFIHTATSHRWCRNYFGFQKTIPLVEMIARDPFFVLPGAPQASEFICFFWVKETS